MNKAYNKARKMAERSRRAREEWENDYKDRMNRFKKQINERLKGRLKVLSTPSRVN